VLGAPSTFWGKLRQSEKGGTVAWHPLVDHCADVAACCEALLQRTLIGRRLAHLVGLDDLSAGQVARLSSLAALHDVGKFNVGFWNKALPKSAFQSGHVREVLALFGSHSPQQDRLCAAIPLDAFNAWGSDEAALRLLVAAICHHGRPLEVAPGAAALKIATCWTPARNLDPFAGISDLTARLYHWFPEAFVSSGHLLPSTPVFQHAFSGLVTLADWVGSDTRVFPFSDDLQGDRIGFAREQAALALRWFGIEPSLARDALGREPPSFNAVFAKQPYSSQSHLLDLPIGPRGSIALLEAETGSGKTEAALARYLRMFYSGAVDGLYFALPTRTAATQMHRRVLNAVERAFPDPVIRPPVILAVPGYLRVDDQDATRLPGFEVLWNDDPLQRYRFRGWAAENPKRYLAGSVVVGTIDQVLLSTLTVSHAHMRSTALLRLLLVVDEVHASDSYMIALLREVLAHLTDAGGHALLMSATLGSTARLALLEAARPLSSLGPGELAKARTDPYPLITHCAAGNQPIAIPVEASVNPRRISISLSPLMDHPAAIAALALDAASRCARVLVIRNTVRDCVATQLALEELANERGNESLLFSCEGMIAPHHARYATEDRAALDVAIEMRFGKDSPDSPCAVITTQTVQQSLDIDADLMITDLCPIDVMLQRLGRLHRHGRHRPAGFDAPAATVLIPSLRDLTSLIGRDGHGRGEHGLGTVYEDLRIIEATWRLLESNAIFTIPDANRALVEDATHPDALDEIVRLLGPVWEKHANHLSGVRIAQRRLAELNVINRSVPFGEYEFSAAVLDRRIQTRLGEGDRLVEFDQPIAGPFGRTIHRLTIPAYLAAGAPHEAKPLQVSASAGVAFVFGAYQFTYDRLGVRRNDVPATPEEDLADA